MSFHNSIVVFGWLSSLVRRGWGEGTGRGLDLGVRFSEASVLVGDQR